MESVNQKIVETMNYYLIGCGVDAPVNLVLVKADTYELACNKIVEKKPEYKVFYNATIE
jgi:hypothetical protein